MLTLETNSMSRISLIAALALAVAVENWPTRPITMVVPFAAGGGSDVVARMIAPRLGDPPGQQVVIENLGGSGGMIGSYKVARAGPDGYQVGFAVTGTHAQNQSLYKTPLYDAATDFAPVGLISPAAHSASKTRVNALMGGPRVVIQFDRNVFVND